MSTMVAVEARMEHAGARILSDHPKGLRARELWALVAEQSPSIEEDYASLRTGTTSATEKLQWKSIRLVKAGWLTKSGGRWFLTSVGRTALRQFPDPEVFYETAGRHYRYWKQNRAGFDLAQRLVESIPEGSWATASDVATVAGIDAAALVHWLQGERPEGWHRVLDNDGGLPDEVHADDIARQSWEALLHEDEVDLTLGRAPAHLRARPGAGRGSVGRARGAGPPRMAGPRVERAGLQPGVRLAGGRLLLTPRGQAAGVARRGVTRRGAQGG
jgi:5-methylcytosine-specific restriction protein B